MSQDRDPLLLLSRVVEPEPDPAIMRATIAQSREAFARRQAASARSPRAAWRDWLGQSTKWLVPAGVGAAALTVAVFVAPGLIETPPSAERDRVAERPMVESDPASTSFSRSAARPADAPESNGVRMGMQPAPSPAPEAARQPQVSVFQGHDIRIEIRRDASGLEFSFPDISGQRAIDRQVLMPGEEMQLLDAFRLRESDMVAVRVRVDDARFWRVYALSDGAYARNTELSNLVSDTADQADVERRLAAN